MNILKHTVLAILLAVLPFVSQARSIVSDSWTTGNLPDKCGYIEGSAAPVMSPVEQVTGGPRCHIPIDGVTGTHTYKIFARSAIWGDSTQVLFTFTAEAPSAPAGLRIIP